MDEGNIAAISTLIFIAFGVIAVGFIIFRTLVSTRWNRHRAKTVDKWAAEGIEFIRGPVGSQFAGTKSTGSVARSIGLAVMTESDFRITRASMTTSWCITYKQIKGVAIRWDFLDRTANKTPFIVVRFVKDGKKDKLGFQVKDYEEWAEELAEASGVTLRDLTDE